jgi:hypothetical protein
MSENKIETPLASPANYFEAQFSALPNTPYHIWFRMKADDNYYGNDSLHVQFSDSLDVNGAEAYRVGSTSAVTLVLEEGAGAGLSGWGWADNDYGGLGANVKFSGSGTHTLRVQQREDGLAIDQIVISPATYITTRPGLAKDDNTILTVPATPPPPPGPVPPPPAPAPTPVPPPPAPSPSPSPKNLDNRLPVGYFDEITSTGVGRGWAIDNDTKTSPTLIHVYVNGPAGKGVLMEGLTTSILRTDVNSLYNAKGNHGFEFIIPSQYRNGVTHSLYVYAIDTSNPAFSTLLTGSPKTFNVNGATNPTPLPAPTPGPTPPIEQNPGPSATYPDGTLILDDGTIYIIEFATKRGFTSMDVFNGLGFKLSRLMAADINNIPTGQPISEIGRHTRGVMVSSQGVVYFMGKDLRYPFPSSEVFHSWGGDFSSVVNANSFDMAVPQGPIVQMKQ